jgi:tRNA G18 (ribose-2'-O)-methylase SpoU
VHRCQWRQFHVSTTCRFSQNFDDVAAGTYIPEKAEHSSVADDGRERRKQALHVRLQQLGVDVDALSDAAFRSVATTDGFDRRFGKSAIKAYRTYIDPRPSKLSAIAREDVNIGANRIARQIDFLAKKHRSREAEWVRHTDEPKDGNTFPLILVLDNLRSAANVGSIYRSADACGCLEILTTGITPHPNGNGEDKLAKSALGAERVVSTKHFETTMQALDYLRKERPNVMLVAMETTERSKCYTAIQYPSLDDQTDNGAGVALFLGNEVSGVDTDIMPLLDEVIEIPMFGKKNSLNVASCAPVVMYEVLRQWGAFP